MLSPNTGKYQERASTSEACVSMISKPTSLYQNEDHSVPNRLQPRKQPGVYMIRCLFNDWRYYGESSNVSGRLASHRSLLNRQIHPNQSLQIDWTTYGDDNFDFCVLFMGPAWDLPFVRRGKEMELIVLDRALAYNVSETYSRPGKTNPFWGRLHSPETKKKISEALKNKPNDLLGRKVCIRGVLYPSIAEASRQTGMSRKTIRSKLNDVAESQFVEREETGTVERPSQRE